MEHGDDERARARSDVREDGTVRVVHADVVREVTRDGAHLEAGDRAGKARSGALASKLERRPGRRAAHAVVDEHARRVEIRRQIDANRDGREDALFGVALRGRDVEQPRLAAREGRARERKAGGRCDEARFHGAPSGRGAPFRRRMRKTTRRFLARPFFGRIVGNRLSLAVTLRHEALRRDAVRDEPRDDRPRAFLGEPAIELDGARLVGVTLDFDGLDVGMFREQAHDVGRGWRSLSERNTAVPVSN